MYKKERLPSFTEPVDAIVLAGTDRNAARMIQGQNKAFLEIDGRPLVRHVVDALAGARSIADIFVIGPVEEVRGALRGEPDRVHLIPQQGNMLSNCWAGVHASEARQTAHGLERNRMRAYLLLSSDLPLVSPAALDDFVARCADDDRRSVEPYGLMVGVADEEGLRPFSADGMSRPFVELAFARVRLANIYVARPWLLGNEPFLQTGFNFRKAIHLRNVLGLAWNFLSQEGGWQAVWMTLRLQATLLAARRGGRLYRRLRRWNTRERVEARTSRVLGGLVRLVLTPFGGLSVDVDDEHDFRVMSARYHEWIAIHNAVSSEYPVGPASAHSPG